MVYNHIYFNAQQHLYIAAPHFLVLLYFLNKIKNCTHIVPLGKRIFFCKVLKEQISADFYIMLGHICSDIFCYHFSLYVAKCNLSSTQINIECTLRALKQFYSISHTKNSFHYLKIEFNIKLIGLSKFIIYFLLFQNQAKFTVMMFSHFKRFH